MRSAPSPDRNTHAAHGWMGRLLAALLLFSAALPAWAHRGPPFPILQNHEVGSLNVSVWSNPDVGNGLFYVLLRPVSGTTVPRDLKVQIAVQPLSRRLPEKAYDAHLVEGRSPVEYAAVVPFDRVEMWHVRVLLQSPKMSCEADVDVRTMPAGLGRWDLFLYILPFAAIALLWLRASVVKRKRRLRIVARTGSASRKAE